MIDTTKKKKKKKQIQYICQNLNKIKMKIFKRSCSVNQKKKIQITKI